MRWRRSLLWVAPIGILAFALCVLLEVPSGQALPFDMVAYPIGALFLSAIQLLLWFRPRYIRQIIIACVVGVSSFFLVRLTYLMTLIGEPVNIPAQLAEGFYWIPVIYLLALSLPYVVINRSIQTVFALAFTSVTILFIAIGIWERAWDVVYAVTQLSLANIAVFILIQAFAKYKEDLVQTKAQLQLTEHYAYTDALTHLPNRYQLDKVLEQYISQASALDTSFTVLFIDFDNFKLINDLSGHEAGDAVLKAVADRMRDALPENIFLARLSGDEFVAVSEPGISLEQMQFAALQLTEILAEPLRVLDDEIKLSMSIGLSNYPDDAISATELLNHADAAMYRVKHTGKNGLALFDHKADDLSYQRRIQQDIRLSLERQEISLVAQPILELSTGKISRFEILTRWNHGKLGMVSPALFIVAAEQNGFIIQLGEWILLEACKTARLWVETQPEIKIAVNVSRVQLSHPDFLASVKAALEQSGLAARHLELEMTETALTSNPARTKSHLEDLRALGVSLALDDFGSGYSSLTSLNEFPFDVLKADRTFVAGIGQATEDLSFGEAVLDGIVRIGRSLQIELLAEGIETKEEYEACKHLNFHYGQGYFISKPIPLPEVPVYLKQNVTAASNAQRPVAKQDLVRSDPGQLAKR